MENRIQNGSPRVATNAPANGVSAPRITAAPANATLNTVDAAAFSSNRAIGGTDLAEIQAVLSELQDRIAALEARVAELQGDDPAAPANLGPASAANQPAANGIQLPAGMTLPPLPGAAADTPAGDDYVATDDMAAPALNAVANEAAAIRESVDQLQNRVADQMAVANAADAATLGGQQQGLDSVAHVLKGAKLSNLTPQEEQVVGGALKRVHEIGREIAGGAAPGQYAAELFALKHTLADPAGAGRHPVVTSGAQAIMYIEEQKDGLAAKILANQVKLARKADPVLVRENEALNNRFKGLVNIEKALGGAALTGLTPTGEAAADKAVDRLSALAEAIATGAADPVRAEGEIYKLGQALKRPEVQAQSAVVDAGADVVSRIAQGKSAIHARLRELDEKVMQGAPPESLVAERAKLLANAEALEELGEAVKSARLDQGNAKERREVSFGLAKAGAIADAIGSGKESASRLRGEIFVLKQTFQEPLASKENPAVQAGAAALQLIGQAETQTQQQRDAIAAAAAKGQDMRAYDGKAAQLGRRAEDLETLRKGIADADLGGLTPAQEGRGAEIIDQMRAIAGKVAAGEDFGPQAKAYAQLAAQLRNLRQGGAPTPGTQPPLPAGNDDVPVPTPAQPPAPASQTRPYTVKKGDYLTKIAKEQLGDQNRYAEIVALNVDKYPSLRANPDLIQPGWVLQLPVGGTAAPKPAGELQPKPKPKPKPAPQPQPKPPAPKPTPVDPPTPAASGLSDTQALDWLRRNADAQGRVSRETVARMPAGPGKDAMFKHFDALLFGTIDAGREGWTHLHAGDLDKISQALRGGKSIDQLATDLTMSVLLDRQVGDKNGDGRMDESDVRVYARELRNQTNAPTPPTPVPAPLPAADPAVNAPTQRLREDLDRYLNQPENRNDSEAALHLLRTAPQYAVAATPEQKARIIKLAIDGTANADERKAALKVLQMAAERGEIKAVLAASGTKELKDLLSDLGDEKEGVEAAKLLLRAGAYADERTWKAMDDDAVRGLMQALDYKAPMIGTNDQLHALPEAAKHHMIKELLAGNLTWGELAMAEWVNQHTSVKAQIPDYRNR